MSTSQRTKLEEALVLLFSFFLSSSVHLKHTTMLSRSITCLQLAHVTLLGAEGANILLQPDHTDILLTTALFGDGEGRGGVEVGQQSTNYACPGLYWWLYI